MKFFAAALLAIGATAISLQGTDKLPFPAPTKCPEKPTLEDLKAATPEQVFDVVDADKSGAVSLQEAFNALYCLNSWDYLSEADAKTAYSEVKKAAGADGSLTKAEAGKAAAKYIGNAK